jgi:hypothetical protein
MAITLRNKKIEETIRRLGRPHGEGPSAVIARLALAEDKRVAEENDRGRQERLARMRAFRATLPKFTDEEREAARRDLQEMHDYLYQDEDKA